MPGEVGDGQMHEGEVERGRRVVKRAGRDALRGARKRCKGCVGAHPLQRLTVGGRLGHAGFLPSVDGGRLGAFGNVELLAQECDLGRGGLNRRAAFVVGGRSSCDLRAEGRV